MGEIVKLYVHPDRKEWMEIMSRSKADESAQVTEIVAGIINEVKARGDEALCEYELRFDRVRLDSFRVSNAEIEDAERLVPEPLKAAIAQAQKNIAAFHSAQLMQPVMVETTPGVECEQRQVAIESVGMYVPGGNSPLFSTVLMLAVPAAIAGCSRRVLCTPPGADGKVNAAILYAASLAGVEEIYKVGGAQAIAAMALGTESIPKVSKIFGPGNRFVMEAKQQVTKFGTAIDMPAGPSEVMVIADDAANPDFVAWDFLSQAEHGPDSQSIALVESEAMAQRLEDAISRHIADLPRREMMLKSLSHSSIVVLDKSEIMDFANEYAPEHLIINTADADALAARVVNAGSVFIGAFSPESAGDYASGTNHTLPTSGFAKCYNGVNIDSYMRKITFQRLSKEGLQALGGTIEIMAENEDLIAHKQAVTWRLNHINE